MAKHINVMIQETKGIPNGKKNNNDKKIIPRHITIKLLKTKDKNLILEVDREK